MAINGDDARFYRILTDEIALQKEFAQLFHYQMTFTLDSR